MKEKFVVLDLDDTLSSTEHRRALLAPAPGERKKNWKAFFAACGEDPIREKTMAFALAAAQAGAKLAVFTGRPEAWRVETERWLEAAGLRWSRLEMRPEREFRKIAAVKLRWARALAEEGEILGVVDDDGSTLEAFFEAGILCAHPDDEAALAKIGSKVKAAFGAGAPKGARGL